MATTDLPKRDAIIVTNTPRAGETAEQTAVRMRTFSTGATRNPDQTQPDYEGFMSPRVVQSFGRYMHKNRKLPDGSMRDSDNWQKGIPLDSYMKSMFRHFIDVWANHRGVEARADMEDSLNALLFNVQGYLHEYLKAEAAKNNPQNWDLPS